MSGQAHRLPARTLAGASGGGEGASAAPCPGSGRSASRAGSSRAQRALLTQVLPGKEVPPQINKSVNK